jgi:xylulose-5-phosphate/fructose-6-phosphate phosphoketolase
MAATLDRVVGEIQDIQQTARAHPGAARPAWPVIVLRTLKGWTGPKEVGGLPAEGTWR